MDFSGSNVSLQRQNPILGYHSKKKKKGSEQDKKLLRIIKKEYQNKENSKQERVERLRETFIKGTGSMKKVGQSLDKKQIPRGYSNPYILQYAGKGFKKISPVIEKYGQKIILKEKETPIEKERKRYEQDIQARERLADYKKAVAQKYAIEKLGRSGRIVRQASQFSKGFSGQLKSLQKQFQPQQVRPQQRIPQRREQQTFIPNFFEHREPMEVYGDDGLTFFDSQKGRSQGRTGSLFGF